MPVRDRSFEESAGNAQDDLRARVADLLLQQAEVIIADAVAIFPHTATVALDQPYCARLGQTLVRLLAFAIRDARVDPRGALVADLRAAVLERSLEPDQLFTFAYLTERSALDEVALHDALGAGAEPWPLVAQLVRRGSFDYLAAFAARRRLDPTRDTITDSLTTLHTRPVFDAVLLKEAERCGRFGDALSLILFDVDRLTSINEQHGYGVGNRILERLGIMLRKFFRLHDWVARYGDDEIAVLLTGSDADHAGDLAERARAMIEARLGFTDHRTATAVPVTIRAAVVQVRGSTSAVIDPERLLIEAAEALARARKGGGNRVEVFNRSTPTRALPRSSPSA